jgi:hypothetical protein
MPMGCEECASVYKFPMPSSHEDVAPGFYGSTGWGDAICLVPWALWNHYGDRDILQECFPVMVRWVDFVWSISAGRAARHPCGRGQGGMRIAFFGFEPPEDSAVNPVVYRQRGYIAAMQARGLDNFLQIVKTQSGADDDEDRRLARSILTATPRPTAVFTWHDTVAGLLKMEHLLGLRHPRPGGGDDAGRPHRRARSGGGASARSADGAPPPPAEPVRRGFHRLAEDEFPAGHSGGCGGRRRGCDGAVDRRNHGSGARRSVGGEARRGADAGHPA